MKNIIKLAKFIFKSIETVPFLILSIGTFILFGILGRSISAKQISNTKCVVLGNGPSLKNDINALLLEENTDFLCVNHFADSEFYKKLKPKSCFFVDPYFWRNDTSAEFKSKRKATFQNIIEKTTWPLNIYVPYSANRAYFKDIFLNCEFITLTFYSCGSVKGLPSTLSNVLLDTGMFVPLGINVLTQATFSAVRSGYQDVYIYGADSSWHQSLSLDQKTNELFMVREHFYGESLEPVFKDHSKTVRSSVADELMFVSLALRTYMQISDYAKFIGVHVYNGSSLSWIDAFDRKNV